MEANSRRRFLKTGATAAGAMLATGAIAEAIGATCGRTPPQTAGPFYPGESRFTSDTDLTYVPGRTARAQGQVIYIKGRVVDAACRPVVGANVEIWQACASGKYNNPNDPNPAPLDPNFKYWAETFTDAEGRYEFKSIVPGAYPADVDWERPPHIHFKVSQLGFQELVTQMYFRGNPLNDEDLILRRIPAGERQSVIVDFAAAPADHEIGSLVGSFEITLRSVR
jgi:protocatechuate 3,4-dioxygenase beta subunit